MIQVPCVDVTALPLDARLLEFVQGEKARGRRVYLASTFDRRHVERLANQLGFYGVVAPAGGIESAQSWKAEYLQAEFGPGGFDYILGNDYDSESCQSARRIVASNCSPQALRALARRCPDLTSLGSRQLRWKDYLSAMRLHQWSKNTLLLLPMLAGHAITPSNIGVLTLAIASFSFTASSIYVVNDILDIESDREHPTKKSRPFAAGLIPITHGFFMATALLLGGLATAAIVSPAFLGIVCLYFAASTAYSLFLKRTPIVDVLTLAGLYTWRLVGGAVAIAITLSPWMLAFSMFLFLCLALVKRLTELKDRVDSGKGPPAGRGYLAEDLPLILALSCTAGYSAVVVLALYVNSSKVTELYSIPEGLWLACGLLLYWITRALLLANRGKMHCDPLVYALRDRVSVTTILLTGAVVLGSAII